MNNTSNKIKVLKIYPHFEYRVWAGNKIKKTFNLKQMNIGEAWLVSGMKEKSSIIENLNNQTLYDFFKNKKNGYFFNNYNLDNEYPLLSKIIDAKHDLSVQIHPDDEYAKKYNSVGKAECWYILSTVKNNSIIYGHNAQSIEEFKLLVKNQEWNKLLKSTSIKKNDFFYVDAKKIHAIKGGTLIFELQQSSDITYRVFDYNRLDKGKLRELHLDHVFNLIQAPDIEIDKNLISNNPSYLVSNSKFNLKLIKNNSLNKKEYIFSRAKWVQLTIIKGEGFVNNFYAKAYDSFLIAYNEKVIIEGRLSCLIYYIE